MDEKTEQLRDIFVDVADDETVTEQQTDERGSLVRDGSVRERLADVVERMQAEFEFASDRDREEYCTVVEQFYDGADDDDIAAALDIPAEAVFEARMDLHLVRESDAADVDLSALRRRLREGDLDALDVDEKTLARARRVVEAQDRSRRVSHRYRTEFEEVLGADIADRLAEGVREDGLDEAAEDIETDVDF